MTGGPLVPDPRHRRGDAVLPFGAAYKPFWLGLGALSLDLLAAVVITSLLRRRIGRRAWRLTHWLTYVSWPVALAHSLGTGTDAGSRWMLIVAAGCLSAVLAAVLARRIPRGNPAASRLPRANPAAPRRLSAAAPGRSPTALRG